MALATIAVLVSPTSAISQNTGELPLYLGCDVHSPDDTNSVHKEYKIDKTTIQNLWLYNTANARYEAVENAWECKIDSDVILCKDSFVSDLIYVRRFDKLGRRRREISFEFNRMTGTFHAQNRESFPDGSRDDWTLDGTCHRSTDPNAGRKRSF